MEFLANLKIKVDVAKNMFSGFLQSDCPIDHIRYVWQTECRNQIPGGLISGIIPVHSLKILAKSGII